MAQCKPAPLCNHLMPSGKLCRGVALRDQRYCRSHIRNSRLLERGRAELAALEQLDAQVRSMDFPTLLDTLKVRLVAIARFYPLPRFHELCYLISTVVECLEQSALQTTATAEATLNSPKSNTLPQIQWDQIPEDLSPYSPSEVNQMIAKALNSIA